MSLALLLLKSIQQRHNIIYNIVFTFDYFHTSKKSNGYYTSRNNEYIQPKIGCKHIILNGTDDFTDLSLTINSVYKNSCVIEILTHEFEQLG